MLVVSRTLTVICLIMMITAQQCQTLTMRKYTIPKIDMNIMTTIIHDDDSDTSFLPSSLSCWSSSSSSSSLSSSSSHLDGTLPLYDPPMFSAGPTHMSAAFKLQSELNNLFDRNEASIAMYDEMIDLFNGYIESSEFNKFAILQPRRQFIATSEKTFGISSMAPHYSQVQMTDNTIATVPVFDARAMILFFCYFTI